MPEPGCVVLSNRISGAHTQGNPTPEDANRVEPEVSIDEVAMPMQNMTPVMEKE